MPSMDVGAEVRMKRALNRWFMGAVIDPIAGSSDPFAGADCGGVPHDRYQIAVATRFGPQNAEAVLGVVEGHPFDQASEHLTIG
jgi:hypothetical protein